jgi:hypothetical protein
LWNPSTDQFSAPTTIQNGSWSINYSLYPGYSADLYTPSSFVATFVGTLLEVPSASDGPGLYFLNGDNFVYALPPAINIPGLYLLSAADPLSELGFEDFVGRAPVAGESVTILNNATYSYTTYTYEEESGEWGWWYNDPNTGLTMSGTEIPEIPLSGAAWFELGGATTPIPALQPIPEPSSLVLSAIAIAVAVACARRRRRVR